MDMGIKGRKAIVCAASKGLGRGVAEALPEFNNPGVSTWSIHIARGDIIKKLHHDFVVIQPCGRQATCVNCFRFSRFVALLRQRDQLFRAASHCCCLCFGCFDSLVTKEIFHQILSQRYSMAL